jgi:ferritin-like metal-binding protein YciE
MATKTATTTRKKTIVNGRGASNGGLAKTKKSTTSEGLGELFKDQLKDIYWAEKALVKALPKMMKNASNEVLIDAIGGHLEVTKLQVTRLEDVFASIGLKPQAKECVAMQGLIKEAEEIIEEAENPFVCDAGIIAAAQKVEHYEIASYGTLRAFALALGFDDAAELLGETLEEEKEADDALTEIADDQINSDAVNMSDEDDEDEDDDEV